MRRNKGYGIKVVVIAIAILLLYMRNSEFNKPRVVIVENKTIEISYKVNSGMETNSAKIKAAGEQNRDIDISLLSKVGESNEKIKAENNGAVAITAEKNNLEDKTNEGKQRADKAIEDGEEKSGEVSLNKTIEDTHKDVVEKVAYLTFDDGPTQTVTPKILEILKKEDIKATFFVIGYMAEKNPELLLREKSEGHAIANHSYTHAYAQVYASTDGFLDEIKRSDTAIKAIVGEYRDKLIRFPGGSFKRTAFIDATKAEGYHYVDWNCSSGDATGKKLDEAALVNNVIETSKGKNKLVILMHDSAGKESTAEALPEAIRYLRSQGYVFKTLE